MTQKISNKDSLNLTFHHFPEKNMKKTVMMAMIILNGSDNVKITMTKMMLMTVIMMGMMAMMKRIVVMTVNEQTACRLGLLQIPPVNISHLSNFF